MAPGPQEALEEIDCIWYVRGRGAFLFDVEWMAALDEAVLQRGPRIETTDSLVRFLVVADERVPLVRLRLARSPVLRARLEDGQLAYPAVEQRAPAAREQAGQPGGPRSVARDSIPTSSGARTRWPCSAGSPPRPRSPQGGSS